MFCHASAPECLATERNPGCGRANLLHLRLPPGSGLKRRKLTLKWC